MRPSLRALAVTVAFLGGGSLAGGLLGDRVRADADPEDRELRSFNRILAVVEDHYVGKLDSEAMVEEAIQGMVRTLDPHSNYLDRDQYSEMKDDQRGKFYGLGIQINKRGPEAPLTIIAPIDGTPASRAGLQAGDIIYKIEGEETQELTVQQAVRKLKGDKGTKVTITIQRPGDDKPFDVTLVRDEIPTHSVTVAVMLADDVGMVRISNFTSTTSQDLDEAIKKLSTKGMRKLILDLRGNPGGLLEQAVGVSERFVPAGKMVVYTRGRVAGADQDYPASKGVERVELPMVVLVSHNSASASEIVAGAIQDHDRGLIVGETTFGKGLVQRVIQLRNGGALALTTAKYYTPSGRLIQREYADRDDYFLDAEEEDAEGNPVEPTTEGREIRHTDSGRVVYGGGGITPDYVVHSEKFPAIVGKMLRDNLLFDYAVRYVAAHPDLKAAPPADAKFVEEFKAFLVAKKFEYEPAAFDADKDLILRRARAQIARLKWGTDAEALILAESDPQVRKALTLFDEAARLAQEGAAAREQQATRLDAEPEDGR